MFNALFLFFIGILVLGVILLAASALMGNKLIENIDKFDTYECGFKAFNNSSHPIEIHFFLLCVLFVVFDLEIIYFLPWFSNIFMQGLNSFFALIFMLLLVFGYVYEHNEGLFDWSVMATDAQQSVQKDV